MKGSPPLVPWYVIAWRCIWFIPAYWAGALFLLVTMIGWGPRKAAQFYSEIFK